MVRSCSSCETHKNRLCFDHYIWVCSIAFSNIASKAHSFEEANIGSRFSVCFVRCERNTLGTREGIFCQAFSAGPTLGFFLFLSLSLSLSLPVSLSHFSDKGTDIEKDCTLVCVQQKLSAEFHPLLNLSLNNTRATNQNMLDTEVRSWAIDHLDSGEVSLCKRRGRVAATLTDGYRDLERHSGPILRRLSPCLCQTPHFPSHNIFH